MKSLEWTGPDCPAQETAPRLYQSDLDAHFQHLKWVKHEELRRWQDACVMNMIFGDNYVTTPEIPKGYEDYAKWWRENELKAYK